MNTDDARTFVRITTGIHIAFLALAALAMLAVMTFIPVGSNMASFMGAMMGVVLLIIIAMMVVLVGVFQLKPWARVPGIIVGALSILSFPIGTILGIIEIWLLAFNDESKRLFEPARPVVAKRASKKAVKKKV